MINEFYDREWPGKDGVLGKLEDLFRKAGCDSEREGNPALP